jgi:pimeloyl-ACP methyl ester carboxylesterase/predicted glycosyltransferase
MPFIERNGVRVAYTVHGRDTGAPAILLGPTWPIVHSAMWKAQVPYLARHFRVITVDPRGNGASDRPDWVEAYTDAEYAEDLISVLDAAGQSQAVVAGVCSGSWWAALAAATHPERFTGIVALAPAAPLQTPGLPARLEYSFDIDYAKQPGWTGDEGWAQYNRHALRRDFRGFLEFFFDQLFPEPHSTKQREDGVAWGSATDAETLTRTNDTPHSLDPAVYADVLRRVSCPVLAIWGTADNCQPQERMEAYVRLTRARAITVEGGGHLLFAREPVAVNRWIRDFTLEVSPPAAAAPPRRSFVRASRRLRRALFLSSPIGLGHARRDLAIADELRTLHPDLAVDWLTQHPVSAFLRDRGERIHPASALLANESAHFESEAGEHDLHAFQALRRMDEILVANFMVFDDLLRDEPYDVVIGDEAWDVDYFLHENPELKRQPFVWLTDFVGLLPMPSGGDAEIALAADYNAEMIEQVARYPRLRDRSLFVGNPDDVVSASFGPGLPTIADWTSKTFDFVGYVTGSPPPDRAELRSRLGYRDDERVCVVSVGGSGVGGPLLRRVTAAYPALAEAVPGLRLRVFTGPRIDPSSVAAPPGVEVRGYDANLDQHLAACDVAIVQGGLTTTMELTAAGTPFVYVPLRNHFEQNLHVRHRLERYRAGRCLPYDELTPESLAEAVATELGRAPAYRPVETTGAATAAARIAELL